MKIFPYIPKMEPHSKSRRNSEDNAESYTEKQSDHGRVVVPAEIMGDDYPCPDPDGNNNRGNCWTDNAGDDYIMSPARNMFGKMGRHIANVLCSKISCWGLKR